MIEETMIEWTKDKTVHGNSITIFLIQYVQLAMEGVLIKPLPYIHLFPGVIVFDTWMKNGDYVYEIWPRIVELKTPGMLF
jgi:hypothetical protein